MALIQCGECRRSISSLAAACVHCGAAIPGSEGVKSQPGASFSTQTQSSGPEDEASSDDFADADETFDSAFKTSVSTTTNITLTFGPGDEIPASVQALINAGLDSAKSSDGTTTTTTTTSTRTYGPGDELPESMQILMNTALDRANLAAGNPRAATSASVQASAAPAQAPTVVFPVSGASDTGESEASAPKRSFSILLWLGVIVMPPVFVWFLLRKGHSIFGRILGFSWLALNVFAFIAVGQAGL